ncbi:unnamed protein product [Pedinophyceae sp. YPF-701]|nr:unnamed protein product [Pedinophyceae sp. YPF-701]
MPSKPSSKAEQPAEAPEVTETAPVEEQNDVSADVEDLNRTMSSMKIEDLVKQDPKFIERAINGLDKMMDNITKRRKDREMQIQRDNHTIEGLDKEISMYEEKLGKVKASLAEKQAERNRLAAELATCTGSISSTVHNAESAFAKARLLNRKIARQTASDRLAESRGFDATVPTSVLVKTRGTVTRPPPQAGSSRGSSRAPSVAGA